MKKDKKYNYKLFIGILVGLLLSGTVVSAAILYASNIIFYNNANSSLSSNNVQAAIDELATQYNSLTCPDDRICNITPNISLGDYVSYTPIKTSYTTVSEITGDSGTQIINPSELNLWRVIKINDNGSVEIISNTASSVYVYFSGLTGYQNFVGYLNVLASQYENSTYTVGSRYFGYNGQTQFITDTSKFTTTAPWTCYTSPSCNSVESQGGGDMLYLSDYNLVNTVLGSVVARVEGTSTFANYWMASRNYSYESASNYHWGARRISNSGGLDSALIYGKNNTTYVGGNSIGASLRPIVILRPGLEYTGAGTSGSPKTILNT